MYKDAIKNTISFIRPMITGSLLYGEKKIINSIATMCVINKNGDILTCGHTADNLLVADEILEVYKPILEEMKNKSKREIKKIEEKYGINDNSIVSLHNILVDVAENPGKLNIIKHPYLDLAIIKISNNEKLFVKNYPKFKIDEINIGEDVCKIGFAFPEYKAFKYDEDNNSLVSNPEFMNFPVFPQNGMITRNIAGEDNLINMFEVSNGFNDHDGALVVNEKTNILGMVVGCKKLTDNVTVSVAVNSMEITKFLKDNNVEFEEE